MATDVSAPVQFVADEVVHHCGYKSAVLSGIRPNAAHLISGGFHCSVVDLRAHGNGDDYSNTRPDDHNLNIQYGAAVDVSMTKTDLVLAYQRVHVVWADRSDPRRRFINAVNVWDGSGDATRLDFDKGTAGYADAGHKFHVHMELHRRYLLDARAARAMVSMFKGESKAVWIAREEPRAESAAPKPTGVRIDVVTGKLPELKRGMSGMVAGYNYISRAQLLLGLKGDNDFGEVTEQAVIKYNRDVLKRSSKIIDGVFWKRLYALQ